MVILVLVTPILLRTSCLSILLGVVTLFFILYLNYSTWFWRAMCVLASRCFYSFKIVGDRNNLNISKSIIISNHVSFIDWSFIAAASKGTPRFVMWYVFFKMPIVNIFFKGAKAIPIAGANEDKEILKAAFIQVENEIKAGATIGYFPEGVITKTGQMEPFKRGLERIASIDPDTIFVPIYIENLWGSFFSRESGKACSSLGALSSEFRREVTIKIGEPFRFISLEDSYKRVELLHTES